MQVEIPDALIPRIAQRVAELVAANGTGSATYLDVKSAAEYISAPVSRIYELKAKGAIPCHADGRRLLFRSDELDRYLEHNQTFSHGEGGR